MALHCYTPKNFRGESYRKIILANEIIAKYSAMDLRLTLRQLYYQFVAHHDLPNNERSYQNLGKLISEARLAGLIDWDAIEDRGRVADEPNEWSSVKRLVEVALNQFRLPRWEGQGHYVELWVEKQALAGVLEPVAQREHVTLMVNKGYSSSSAMHVAAQRFIRNSKHAESSVLLYLGDHDPSGEDMVRDVRERLALFGVKRLQVRKVALTMKQINDYDPPPNPAKITDSRAAAYIAKHGDSSWEVDALDPSVLVKLITDEIEHYVVREAVAEVVAKENEQKARLKALLEGQEW